jgi:hypothetical protein
LKKNTEDINPQGKVLVGVHNGNSISYHQFIDFDAAREPRMSVISISSIGQDRMNAYGRVVHGAAFPFL